MTSNRSLVDVIARATFCHQVGDEIAWGSAPGWQEIHLDRARHLLKALSAAGLPAEALEGVMNQTHVVVPREPTDAMVDAASWDASSLPPSADARDRIRAAIAAAPDPEHNT